MSIATDVRGYAELAREQGKTVLSQAGAVVSTVATANKRLVADTPKSAYAALGAADVVAERVTGTVAKRAETVTKRVETISKRVETLPGDAAQNVAKVQENGKALITKTQDDAIARMGELRELLDAGRGSVRALPALPLMAAGTVGSYLGNAKLVYAKLASRGEATLAELRKDRRVSKVLGEVDNVSGAVQAALAPVLRTVGSDVRPAVESAFDSVEDVDLSTDVSAGTAASRHNTGQRSAARRTTAARKPASSTARTTAGTAQTVAAPTVTAKASSSRTSAAKASAAKTGSARASKAAASTSRTKAAASTSRTKAAASTSRTKAAAGTGRTKAAANSAAAKVAPSRAPKRTSADAVKSTNRRAPAKKA